MLFNSFAFLVVFLPIVYLLYRAFNHLGRLQWAIGAVTVASIIFYGYTEPTYVFVILGSIAFNLVVSRLIWHSETHKTRWLTVGIAGNLGLLAYLKYQFLIAGLLAGGAVGLAESPLFNIALPLGISFYTFQQIAYLVDTRRGDYRYSPLRYAFFISFFPQLIAGPIVHHKEFFPQIERVPGRLASRAYMGEFLLPGLSLLIIGLGKKLLLADTFGHYADLAYAAAANAPPTFFEAWFGTIAYGLQIYFDFSAYSDMAIGLGLMFALRLPVNFFSPYKARSITDFWRRWHITLSRFLRDYLYIPLGGNRKGPVRRYANLLITMLLGGLWHGASLTFVFWGALHGLYLCINHGWRKLVGEGRLPRSLSWALTFVAVMLAWVPFRADSMAMTMDFYVAMLGGDGIAIPAHYGAVVSQLGPLGDMLGIRTEPLGNLDARRQVLLLSLGMLIVLALPNSIQIALAKGPRRIVHYWPAAAGLGSMLAVSLIVLFVRQSQTFLYFQF